jgi:N-terminal domain of toast_rack, DUF2154
MNTQKGRFWMVVLFSLVLTGALLLAGCAPRLRVGELQSESQTVELDNAESVRAEITMGAGDLQVTGGAEKLLEADFTYNVAKMKPEVKSTDGTLVISHPEVRGYRTLQDIKDFRNEWDLRFNSQVPMNLRLNMGAGTSDLQLADLSLTGLDVTLGAGISTVDLSGDWANDLDVTFDTGAAELTVRLPKDIGVRVKIEAGPTVVNAPDLTKDGNVYTNAAYGVSDVTLHIDLQAGIGAINLLEID